jgi:hypothetical protein
MKKLLTIIMLATTSINVKADLTAEDFAQVKSNAAAFGYFHTATDNIGESKFYVFTNHKTNNWALIPIEANTVREARMAFVASANAVHVISTVADKQNEDEYRRGVADGAKSNIN